MFAMCTGHAPFRAESSYSVLRLITDKEPRPIREINPDVPEWLCEIIGRLMAKQAEDRFANAKELAALLERCLAHMRAPLINPLPRFVSITSKPIRWTQIMNDKRILALFSISLLVAAFVLPWPIAAFARDELAMLFSGSALLVAIFLAVISRTEYLSRIVLRTVGVGISVMLLGSLIGSGLMSVGVTGVVGVLAVLLVAATSVLVYHVLAHLRLRTARRAAIEANEHSPSC